MILTAVVAIMENHLGERKLEAWQGSAIGRSMEMPEIGTDQRGFVFP